MRTISKLAWRTPLIAIGAACVSLAPARRVHADPGEEIVQVVHHPTDPDVVAFRYRNGGSGLMLSDDGGKTLQLIPSTFIHEDAVFLDTTLAIAGDGTLWLATLAGTLRGEPGGCRFEYEEQLGERFLRDFAVDPEQPELLYAVTGDPEVLRPAGSAPEAKARNGLLVRAADGSWSELGAHDVLMPYGMRLARKDDGLRFVVTARKDEHGEDDDGAPTVTTSFVVRISEDMGESWQEHPFDGVPGRILAIDPTDVDRMVFVVDELAAPDQLLITFDGGRTIEPWLTLTDGSGVTITADGHVIVGDRGAVGAPDAPRGVWSAVSLEDEPRLLSAWQVRCLDYRPASDTLFGCELRGFGTIDRDSGAFTPVGRLTESRLVSCPDADVLSTSMRQLCAGFCLNHFPLAPACERIQSPDCGPCFDHAASPQCTLYDAPADAGTADAGPPGAQGDAGSDAGVAVASGGGCGCAVPQPARAKAPASLLGLALGLAFAARRVRARKPR